MPGTQLLPFLSYLRKTNREGGDYLPLKLGLRSIKKHMNLLRSGQLNFHTVRFLTKMGL